MVWSIYKSSLLGDTEEDGKKATDSEMEMELASTKYEDGGHLPDQGGSASRGNDITQEQQELTATEDSGDDEVSPISFQVMVILCIDGCAWFRVAGERLAGITH